MAAERGWPRGGGLVQTPPGTVPAMTPGPGGNDQAGIVLCVHPATLQGKGCRAANYHDPHGSENQRTQGLNPATGPAAGPFPSQEKDSKQKSQLRYHAAMWSGVTAVALLPIAVGQGRAAVAIPGLCSCPQQQWTLRGSRGTDQVTRALSKGTLSRYRVTGILEPRILF